MSEIKLKYIGKGAFRANLPARDLTADEVNEFGGEEFLTGTGLYVRVDEDAAKEPTSLPKKKNKEQ
jgi:hypothetical protein